jgi:hypothetical protein
VLVGVYLVPGIPGLKIRIRVESVPALQWMPLNRGDGIQDVAKSRRI